MHLKWRSGNRSILPDMNHYSNSQISAYFKCPRRYKLQYIDKVPVPKLAKGVEALMGSSIHLALQELYKQAKFGNLLPFEQVSQIYLTDFDKSISDELIIPRPGLTPEHYRNNGLQMISKFYEANYPFQQSQTVELEYRIRFMVGPYPFVGIIDRLSLDPQGVFEIHDYKTSLNLPTIETIEDDTQLSLYLIGIKQNYNPKTEAKLFWHFLYFQHTYQLTKTEEDLKQLEETMVQKIRTIERDPYYLPNESALCDWCSYTDFCPVKTPALQPPETPDEVLEAVDEYVEQWRTLQTLKQQVKKIETFLSEAEKQIIEYAKQHALTQVTGSKATLPISESWQYQFPLSTDPGRKEFEIWLKEQHLWDEVSSLNTPRLNKLLKDGRFEPETYEALMAFSQMLHKLEIKKVIFPEKQEEESD
ncbi:PD-(D/E)XK nuclease family protein [bacterium]|nr:PD-(D/E)XK nuclease family protein [bacterium]